MNTSEAAPRTLRALIVLCSLLGAAHFLRFEGLWPALACLLPLIGAVRPSLLSRPVALGCFAGGLWIWAELAVQLISFRMQFQQPFLRLSFIMAAVWLMYLAGAVLVLGSAGRRLFGDWNARNWISGIVFVLVAGSLLLAKAKAPMPLLLGERFWPDSGIFWVAVFALYGSIVGSMLLERKQIRSALWILFSAVFFAQLCLGLLGFEQFLMTGKLHLPVPALILAGPLYRGGGLFMPILLIVALALVGPAWCSYLCYIGAWDDRLSRLGPKTPKALPAWMPRARTIIFGATLALPVCLRMLEVPWPWALSIAAVFGLVGIGVMATLSRRSGTMVHCTAYCPIGLANNLIGRILPWKIRIDSACTGCGLCARACRYNALTRIDLERKRPGLTCSLCGDCLPRCPHGHLGYSFPGLGAERSRQVFICLVASLHTIFLAVARI